MIGIFWNIRGLGRNGKLQCLSDLICKYEPDFIGFQETKREQISEGFLKTISGSINFAWHILPANNTASGILLGLNEDSFDWIGCIFKTYRLIATIRNKEDGFFWHLIVVYGTTYAEYKLEFIAELHEVMGLLTYPVLFGGDFNLVREARDKSSGKINANWAFLFNDWINKWALMETKMDNRSYTWSNNQFDPIFAMIDRVFSSTSWDAHFPFTTLHALPRVGSDHAPLLLDSGGSNKNTDRPFRFEKWWLSLPDFHKLVEEIWSTSSLFNTAIDTWLFKTKLFRKKVKGWSINIDASLKKKKRDLLLEFDILDVFSEKNLVFDVDHQRMKEIQNELKIFGQHEIVQAYQFKQLLY